MTQATTAIRHRVEIAADPAEVYASLTEPSGLARWWTTRVEGSSEVGKTVRFLFGDGSHATDMAVEELVPSKLVRWRCTTGPWEGHRFSFDLADQEKGTVLRFSQEGWPEMSDFYMHCNAKWGFFLTASLKPLVETGRGVPHPSEPKI